MTGTHVYGANSPYMTPNQTPDTDPATPHHFPTSHVPPPVDFGNHDTTPASGAIPEPEAVYPVSPSSVAEDGVAGPLTGIPVNPSNSITLHPFLDGETPYLVFILNLALQFFSPMQYIPDGPNVPVAPDILVQPATQPPVYHLKIVCDHLPDWPITFEYDPEEYCRLTGVVLTDIQAITVGDVLSQVHQMLHGRISHQDWGQLDDRKRYMITNAYTTRCSTAPSMELMTLMRNDGVKKVDYLLERVWFRGLVRTCDDPGVLKLIVSRRAR